MLGVALVVKKLSPRHALSCARLQLPPWLMPKSKSGRADYLHCSIKDSVGACTADMKSCGQRRAAQRH